MDEHTRDRGKWPALLLGLLLAIAGVALAVGGGQLLMLGGSAYYLIAGVAVVVAGLLLALRKGAALCYTPHFVRHPGVGALGSRPRLVATGT